MMRRQLSQLLQASLRDAVGVLGGAYPPVNWRAIFSDPSGIVGVAARPSVASLGYPCSHSSSSGLSLACALHHLSSPTAGLALSRILWLTAASCPSWNLSRTVMNAGPGGTV